MISNRIIVFSHVPKTAGTSLNHLFRRHFGPNLLDANYRKNAVKAAYYPEDLRTDMRIYPNLKVISGHCMKRFVNFKEFSPRMEWLTFLRDPIKRFISHYVHEQTLKDRKKPLDLISWSQKKNRSNWMVEMLAGEQNLEKAKEALHLQFKFVGYTEEFETSLKLIKNLFQLQGFDSELRAPRMVIRDTSLKDEVLGNFSKYAGCILSSNDLDIQLFEYFKSVIWEKQKLSLNDSPALSTVDGLAPKRVHGRRLQDWNLLVAKIKRNVIYKPFLRGSEIVNGQR